MGLRSGECAVKHLLSSSGGYWKIVLDFTPSSSPIMCFDNPSTFWGCELSPFTVFCERHYVVARWGWKELNSYSESLVAVVVYSIFSRDCNGHEGVVKLLLGRDDVNPDKLDNQGQTALSCAAKNGYTGVIALLQPQASACHSTD